MRLARPLAGLILLMPTLVPAATAPGLEHPLAPSELALRDGATRRVLFQARWRGETAPRARATAASSRSRPSAGRPRDACSATPTGPANRQASARSSFG